MNNKLILICFIIASLNAINPSGGSKILPVIPEEGTKTKIPNPRQVSFSDFPKYNVCKEACRAFYNYTEYLKKEGKPQDVINQASLDYSNCCVNKNI